MGKKYLVALDGSENSNYALSWALENLIDLNDGVLLLLSIGILSWSVPFEYSAVEQEAENIVNSGKKLVEDYLATKKIELPLELHFNSSTDLPNFIVDFIREHHVDVLVLGNKGNISRHCLSFADCTVVIVRKKIRDKALSKATIYQWIELFNAEQSRIEDAPRSG
ncbi:22200_t:CDS:2, partial [Racocetra persica]